MAEDLKIEIEGIEEMIRNLEKLGTRVALRGPNAAVRAAGSVLIKEMRRRAPVETGSLKKALGQRIKTYRRDKTVSSIVGPRSKRYDTAKGRRNPANYAHLIELGTKPHRIGRGTHPGRSARPFMRPAWDAAAPAARQAVIDKMQQIFDREAAAIGS